MPGNQSLAELLSLQSVEEQQTILSALSVEELEALEYDWRFWARPNQLAPEGEWSVWLALAGRGWGKALALNTKLPTPSGWTTIADIRVGDALFDEQGLPCRVTYVTDVQVGRTCYDVVFDDGSIITADADHRWLTKTRRLRKAETRRIGVPGSRRYFPTEVTTTEILNTLVDNGEANHSIAVADPLVLPSQVLPIPPYVLGAWLGDGDSAAAVLTSADPFILQEVDRNGIAVGQGKSDHRSSAVRYSLGVQPSQRNPVTGRMEANGSLQSLLKALGVLNNKHIPLMYQRASIEQRLALLQGLMDTDGCVSPGGTCEYTSVKFSLAQGVLQLALGLGYKAVMKTGRAKIYGKDCGPKYRIHFTPHTPVFKLPRKLKRQHSGKQQPNRVKRRYIVDVRLRPSVPVRCLTVDSPSHLYLVSEACIATHNTRAGAEWVRQQVSEGKRRRIILIGATAASVRDIMVEGESGILATAPKGFYPKYEPSKTRLTWPNGARAELFSADSPDALRGIQSEAIWVDELAMFRYGQEAWDMAALGRRLGTKPQTMVTTTPRPTAIIKKLVKDPLTHVTKGTTYDNLINMAPSFKHDILSKYEGTRLGRQELNAEILEDNPGALWQRQTIEITRLLSHPHLDRIVVGIDPEISSEDGSAETGIIVAGKARVGNRTEYFVLDDVSLRASPLAWATQAVAAYNKYKADRIIAEGNQGGEMVTQTIVTVGVSSSIVKIVHASRSKQARAEPIAALYEQGKVHHIGAFPILEDQMCQWVPGEPSPDRVDAAVWAISELSQGPELPLSWMKI